MFKRFYLCFGNQLARPPELLEDIPVGNVTEAKLARVVEVVNGFESAGVTLLKKRSHGCNNTMSGLYFDFVTSWISLSLRHCLKSKEQVIKTCTWNLYCSESNQGYHSINHLMKQQKELPAANTDTVHSFVIIPVGSRPPFILGEAAFHEIQRDRDHLISPTWLANIPQYIGLQIGVENRRLTHGKHL